MYVCFSLGEILQFVSLSRILFPEGSPNFCVSKVHTEPSEAPKGRLFFRFGELQVAFFKRNRNRWRLSWGIGFWFLVLPGVRKVTLKFVGVFCSCMVHSGAGHESRDGRVPESVHGGKQVVWT